ncbi:(2Fe-2S) ferredoxin domain-containing protein [Streptomyces sp. B-S-A8]|uniref:(2Fe-2S) ferredoxin domain-containing protein n=1 Tax=Streptomyces solicavernae TaxID=3043614 RepID=A0ABT6RKT6_9ACTN|nr:(2Fe-2S) ferredoxin domain-containing protein [Streptomyces sp. B-S-A8]MDI3385048.1 (2Fe-2S) ferredoxin domain-containing protein [Streptomyces sp. B-S-A8]
MTDAVHAPAAAQPRRTFRVGAAARPCTLVVCRGCCCGNPRKYPRVDHDWQLDRLRAAAAGSGGRVAVRVSDCLGPCDQANVVVVQPSTAGRQAGGKATWIGFAMDDDCTDDLIAWVTAGGPGVAPPPPTLELQFIPPPREARAARR